MTLEEIVEDCAQYLTRFKSDLNPGSGRAVQRALYKTTAHYDVRLLEDGETISYEWSGEGVDGLIDYAGSDPLAAEALRSIARDLVEAGKPAPPKLTGFLLDPPKRRRGRTRGDRADDAARNFRIAMAVFRTKERGYSPTRNSPAKIRNDGRPTACFIVHSALSRVGAPMSESNVERIWSKFSHLDPSE